MKNVDILLDMNGDIIFYKNSTSKNILKVKLFKNNSNVIKIDFDCVSMGNEGSKRNTLKVTLESEKVENDKIVQTTENNEYIIQRIEMIMNTVKGELKYRQDFGAEMFKFMHLEYTEEKIRSIIKEYVNKMLKQIDNNLSCNVRFEAKTEECYRQVLIVEIYKNNELITEKEMELR